MSPCVKPVSAAKVGSIEMFVAMLKPLVTSSIVTGVTPVTKSRVTGASVPVVASLSSLKNCLKNPSPWQRAS